MKLFSKIPLLTAGFLVAAGSVTAKALSPKALAKNCDRMTQELTAFKAHQEGIVTALEQDTWDEGIFKKLEENSRMAEKFRATSNQLAKNAKDSQGPNLRAAHRAVAQGKESVLGDMVRNQQKLSDCISVNNDLWTEVEELTERQKQAVSDAVSRRQPATAKHSVKKHFSMPATQPSPTLSARPNDPEASNEAFHIEL